VSQAQQTGFAGFSSPLKKSSDEGAPGPSDSPARTATVTIPQPWGYAFLLVDSHHHYATHSQNVEIPHEGCAVRVSLRGSQYP